MNRSACLIFNPVAGQGDSKQELATIKRILDPAFDLDIQYTTPEISAGELALKAIANNAEIIIASGGDGTVSAVAEALINSNIPLGAIARGTANAFANALGIPDTIEAACKVIVDGATKKVDAATCNDKPMILLAGVGFEAETVEDADREAKDRLGMLAYVLSGLKQLREFEKFTTTIETDDKIIEVEANAVTVANAAPPTSVLAQGAAGVVYDDGLLDVTIIAAQTRAGAIAISYHLLQTASNKEAAERDDVGYLRTKWVKVTTNPPQKVVLDGELIGSTPIEVKCIPEGLTVFTPIDQVLQAQERLDHLPGIKITTKQPVVEEQPQSLSTMIKDGVIIEGEEFIDGN
ncbi:lipid kinase [Pleurocapsa sp. CCALA 161]|uniref:YegS/Rv2252/BmrU family lipid kinase n=1 Tax=Pleurocapsa sp. CCALA 161 TaxID=2107688 RepID=UPI000D062715|nr:YegS/Rv2252/BmrU family lipid kinase [Pleurocapsa sp. CCALA 161]PSB11414.1 lipid kinase [Pleurocapsa sp. CCALA 161]